MGPHRLHAAAAALLIVVVCALVAASPALDGLRGLSIDALTALRWRVFGNKPAPSAAVVVALDEETFRTPPFEGTPSVTWTREIGRVLTAILDGGAKVVGFDVVFPTSIEQSAVPFGDETLGARVRGFDRDYLRALALGARAGKVVLGQVQHQDNPVLPSPGQRAAVGFGRNIRALNVHNDSDDVIRRLPITFIVDGEPVPSMAAELASRLAGAPPSARVATAGAVPNTITLNFAGGADDIPTYSLVDLHACLEKDDKDFFRRQFDGKIVIIGTLLDVEDRKTTSKRLATGPEGSHAPRCALPAPVTEQKFTRDSIAGVYIHATAVNNLLRSDPLTEFGRIGIFIISFVLAGLAATTALTFGPTATALAFLGLVAAWAAAATAAFQTALSLPLVEPLLAALAALGTTFCYRFVVADRSRRLLHQSFALYLAPSVIEKMLKSNKLPELGGELRIATVYFSDMADFSAASEKIAPAELVAAMNEYLSAMTEIIQAHGGFVDKFIGDAVVAVFGAPQDDPDHAINAVRAALLCAARLPELDRVAAAFQGRTLKQRIGLNSGEAIVGNIGSRRRLSYTVLGDTVNLASRLEGANKFYATTIMASEATKALTGSTFAWREIDTIRVKGRVDAGKVFEPLGAVDAIKPEQAAHAKAYADGLARFRARDFAGAAEAFATAAKDDLPSALFLARAKALARVPPGPDWDPINTLEEK
jgi:class 3 adenylate cyclase